MIKYLILFIHLIGLSFYQFIFGDVTATQNVPSNFKAGEEVVVEVTITKEGVGGFAKVQQNLPEGFLAEVVDAKGATFSFKDNIVKFIWMALPAENEFKVSYKLKTIEGVEGDFSIAGKFSFIDNNERKNIIIPSSAVTISTEELATEETVEEPVAEVTEPVVEEAVETPVAEEGNAVSINCVRNIETIDNGNNFNVRLKVSQTNLEGFAKVVETIPTGFDAEVIDSKGGVFSYKEGEAKILWMAAPTDSEFEIAYKLISTSANQTDYSISGVFSYLENDITQKQDLSATNFKFEPVSEEPIAEVLEEPVVEEEPIAEVVEEPIVEEVPEVIEEEPSIEEKITSTPQPETGITYKVQIGAGHKKVSNDYFFKKFSLNEDYITEAHNGWIKYIVGKFSTYKEARDKRNSIRAKIKTSFVTAYNKGQRITVQEALMISNQKWYK